MLSIANEPTATILAHRIPAFNDNYIWLLQHRAGADVYVVDPGAAAPVAQYLKDNSLNLTGILITHHHNDHVGGIKDLQALTPVPVYGPGTARFSEFVTVPLTESSELRLFNEFAVRILDLPGHTLDHIGYFISPSAQNPLLFCGDTLFAGGCGRLFEGTPAQMKASLEQLAALPPDTRVYCAHEYTLSNLRFAVAAEPKNQQLLARLDEVKKLRENHFATVPSTIALERATNPFLRADETSLAESLSEHVGHSITDPLAVFTATRQWKDSF